jgi:3-hydroxybutyryl-CoA dehydrogenase
MKTLGIVGAGTMGAGIAHVASSAGIAVILYDSSATALANALRRIEADLQKGAQKKLYDPSHVGESLSRITPHSSFDGFSPCELVIEAAIEEIDVKREIFANLERVCAAGALLASNTSSLSITSMASRLDHPERFAGIHFFNPVHVMKLVEIVCGHHTSAATAERASAFARLMGKTPVIARDTPGFIVNRVARPFYGEALRLLGEGVATVEEIDRIVRLEGGFRMGPFELMDLIGIDVNFAVTQSVYEQTFGEPRFRPHPIQRKMVEAGLLGRKTKRGFYDYSE